MIEKIAKTTEETALTHKLSPVLKMKVLAMMVRGEKYGTIRRILKDEHDIDYSDSALSQLRANNKDALREMEMLVMDSEASEAEQIRNESLRQIRRRLRRSADDEAEIDALSEKYRAGELTLSEYRRMKTGFIKLSVKELMDLSEKMFTQAGRGRVPVGNSAPTTTPDEETGDVNPLAVEAILSAIKRGDTVSLQQMVINPKNNV